MLSFCIIGQILVVAEFANMVYEIYSRLFECEVRNIIDPVILSAIVFTVEEFPLAVIRWCINTCLDKPTSNWGYAAAILGMVSPLLTVLKTLCCSAAKDDEKPTSCCKIFSILTIVILGIATFIFNVLNWTGTY